MKLKSIAPLSLGHLANDLYPGMLAPLLPILTVNHDLSLTDAGILVMILQLFSNLSQPVFGIISDHKPHRSYLYLGLILSGLPFALLLNLANLDYIIVCLMISGLGVGMFHPAAAASAGTFALEGRKGISMAFFSSGGSMGLVVAPLAVVAAVMMMGTFGKKFVSFIILLPALIMAVYFFFDKRYSLPHARQNPSFSGLLKGLFGGGRQLFLLFVISGITAMVPMILNSFLPLISMQRGFTWEQSAYVLSISILAGVVGMFLGGHYSDIHGRRKIMSITLLSSSPLLLLFLVTDRGLAVIFLMLAMASISSIMPVLIVMAQKAAPAYAGVASSFVMGVSFAAASVAAPGFGALADMVGIKLASYSIVVIPIIGAITVFFLKTE